MEAKSDTQQSAIPFVVFTITLIKAVSYKEYFRQIFGLSGSKIFVENIPCKKQP